MVHFIPLLRGTNAPIDGTARAGLRPPGGGPRRVPKLLRPGGGSPRPMDTDVNLCKVDDVPDGGEKHFEIMGYDILVVRLGDRFFCVDAACTYKWAMLTDGLVDRERLLITCKDCNGSWDLQTGQPKELPAKFPLTAYRIESVADDLIVTVTYRDRPILGTSGEKPHEAAVPRDGRRPMP